jgi:subtilisin-like proprotein convertase family protein
VKVNIVHTYDADLALYIVGPSGTVSLLASAVGDAGDNFTNTVFDDAAANPITSGAAPFTGSYRPQIFPLSSFDGQSANGTWTFYAIDTGPGDVGTLLNWTMEFNAEPVAVTDSQGLFAFGNVTSGTYSVRPVLPSGWTATSGGAGYPVTISGPGDSFAGNDFGSAKNNRAYLRVRDDQNANGLFEPGEPFVAGRTVYVDSNHNGTLDIAPPPTVISKTASLAIPDNNPTGVSSTVNVTGLTGTILDLDVTINVTHTAVGDLRLNLVSPSGTLVTLVNQRGDDGVNFANTTFDDSATVPIGNILPAESPYAARFIPETPLAAVDGETPNGTWTLQVFDLAANDLGTLDNWSMAIATAASEPSSVSTDSGNAYLDLPAGSSDVRLSPLAGWKFTNPADGKFTFVAAGAPLYESTFGVAESVPPTVTALTVNDGSPQRSQVSSVRVDFSEHVQFSGPPANAFTLTGAGGGVPFTASVDDSGSVTKVTLTFASLADGKYAVAVNATLVKDIGQNALTPPGPLTFQRLYGDMNGDGTVDGTDFGIFGNAFGSSSNNPGYQLPLDFNGDGTIDGTDFAQFGNRFGKTL